MDNYIIFMHDDADKRSAANSGPAREQYFTMLRQSGRLAGGSAIGTGTCVRKTGQAQAVTAHLAGYIIVRADGLEDAKTLLDGNPWLEAGGTVEIRALPRDGKIGCAEGPLPAISGQLVACSDWPVHAAGKHLIRW